EGHRPRPRWAVPKLFIEATRIRDCPFPLLRHPVKLPPDCAENPVPTGLLGAPQGAAHLFKFFAERAKLGAPFGRTARRAVGHFLPGRVLRVHPSFERHAATNERRMPRTMRHRLSLPSRRRCLMRFGWWWGGLLARRWLVSGDDVLGRRIARGVLKP